jgi:hypothetical protein
MEFALKKCQLVLCVLKNLFKKFQSGMEEGQSKNLDQLGHLINRIKPVTTEP